MLKEFIVPGAKADLLLSTETNKNFKFCAVPNQSRKTGDDKRLPENHSEEKLMPLVLIAEKLLNIPWRASRRNYSILNKTKLLIIMS